MNSSLIMADRTTHLKILIVSLLASILLLWIGISARSNATPGFSKGLRTERSMEWQLEPSLLNKPNPFRGDYHLGQMTAVGIEDTVAR